MNFEVIKEYWFIILFTGGTVFWLATLQAMVRANREMIKSLVGDKKELSQLREIIVRVETNLEWLIRHWEEQKQEEKARRQKNNTNRNER